MMTAEKINAMELAAQHCDDYGQHKREMREVARMRAEFNRGKGNGQVRQSNAEKRAQLRTAADVKRDRDALINNTIAKMEQALGATQ